MFSALPSLTRRPAGETHFLTFSQELRWCVYELEPGARADDSILMVHRLRGRVDTGALRGAVRDLVARHEALRTRIVVRRDGPSPAVAPEPDVSVIEEEVSELSAEALDHRIGALADSADGEPLRVALLRRSLDELLLCLLFGPLSADGWSVDTFVRELSHAYQARLAGEVWPGAAVVQQGEVARWQRHEIPPERLETNLDHWERHLSSCPPGIDLFDHATAGSPGPADARFELSARLVGRLKRLAPTLSASPFMVWLALVLGAVHRYTGRDDVVVSTPFSGRSLTLHAGAIGCFAQSMPVRSTVDERTDFRELAASVRTAVAQSVRHMDVDAAALHQRLMARAARDPAAVPPTVRVAFNFIRRESPLVLRGTPAQAVRPPTRGVEGDLAITIFELPDGRTEVTVAAARALAQRDASRQFVATLAGCIADALTDPGKRVLNERVAGRPTRDHGVRIAQEAGAPPAEGRLRRRPRSPVEARIAVVAEQVVAATELDLDESLFCQGASLVDFAMLSRALRAEKFPIGSLTLMDASIACLAVLVEQGF